MRVTIPCSACAGEKRPLVTCPWCDGEGTADHEMATWRGLLHAFHAARISAEPRRADAPVPARPRPVRVYVTLTDDEREPAATALLVPESALPAADPLSFDWGESPGIRLRKSA